jgi:uncharacterized membrane protein
MYNKLVSFKSSWGKIITSVLSLGIVVVIAITSITYAQTSKPAPENTTPNQAEAVEFEIRGTEPFWNVDLNKRAIVFSTPDAQKQTFAYVAPRNAMGRTADTVRVYKLRGDNMLIIKKATACSDGMSEKEYPYSATFVLGIKVLEGCAVKKS